MSGDDWRGLEKIKIPRRSMGDRHSETNSIAQRLAHAKRRAKGVGMAQAGGQWAKQIHAWSVIARIKGGME
jgi:hypothetical protein